MRYSEVNPTPVAERIVKQNCEAVSACSAQQGYDVSEVWSLILIALH